MSRDIATLRELFDRMRNKTDETINSLVECRQELDKKMTSKEGQKLWANFKKYAQYDELKELYRKTMPAISSFEDKLMENNDHNERVDQMMRRIDEVLCQKADKTLVTEFRDYSDRSFCTKKDSAKLSSQVDKQLNFHPVNLSLIIPIKQC